MKTTIATILMLSATAATAGGLSTPIEQPDRPIDFSGFYLGGSIGQQERTVTTETQTGYVRNCVRGEGKYGGKCVVSEHDWNTSPELLALGDPLDGHPSNGGDLSTDFRYLASYHGLWVSEETGTFQYTSTSDISTGSSAYAANNLVGSAIEIIRSEEADTTYGVFGGYRFGVAENAYLGVEIAAYSGDEALITSEATASLALGSALLTVSGGFAQMGDEDGIAYGLAVDYLVSGSMTVGAKAYVAEFDSRDVPGVAARVAWVF